MQQKSSNKIPLTPLFCNKKWIDIRDENKELWRETKTPTSKKCLTLKNMPQVLASFLDSSAKHIFMKRFHLEEHQKI